MPYPAFETKDPAVTVASLASGETQIQAGYLAALITIPAIGLICVIIGLRERSSADQSLFATLSDGPTHSWQPRSSVPAGSRHDNAFARFW